MMDFQIPNLLRRAFSDSNSWAYEARIIVVISRLLAGYQIPLHNRKGNP